MLVTVDQFTKKQLKNYGFQHILSDYGLKEEEVLQILDDLGYINLEAYDDAD